MLFNNNHYLLDSHHSLLWCSAVRYPSESLASCHINYRNDGVGLYEYVHETVGPIWFEIQFKWIRLIRWAVIDQCCVSQWRYPVEVVFSRTHWTVFGVTAGHTWKTWSWRRSTRGFRSLTVNWSRWRTGLRIPRPRASSTWLMPRRRRRKHELRLIITELCLFSLFSSSHSVV